MPGPEWKLRVAVLDMFLEINSHPSHGFEVRNHGATDTLSNFLAVFKQPFQDSNELRFQVWIVYFQRQIGMATFTHEIADSLIHCDSNRKHERGHTGNDSVI